MTTLIILENRIMKTLSKGDRGAEVKMLQEALGLYADGVFGRLTEEAVMAFQREHDLTADGVVGKMTWCALQQPLARLRTPQTDGEGETIGRLKLKKSKRNITEIIVHCTATREGHEVTVDDIRAWHKQRGWRDVGYHYIIYLDGSIHKGRDVDVSGAHTENHNYKSIGVCYVGGCDSELRPKDTRTEKQKASLLTLLRALRKLYPKAKIYGHRDFAVKACPSYDATEEYKGL